jgi:beta-mannosidase
VKRAIEKADPTRPVLPNSGIAPHPPYLDGTDSHLYFGWYMGKERDLPAVAAAWPRMVRFVGEFGAQAVPESADFCEPERWPDLDWTHLALRHNLQKWAFDRYVPPAEYATFTAWQRATQEYQATVIRYHIETLRRLKYRPTGGFAAFLLADAHPAVTWALLGHDRRAKQAWQALSEACAPVIVVVDRMPDVVHPGDALGLDVHVVSDLREPLEAAEVRLRLSWPGDDHDWRYHGDIPADSCVRVGMVRFVVPEAPGELVLDVELVAGDVVASSRYTSTVVQ